MNMIKENLHIPSNLKAIETDIQFCHNAFKSLHNHSIAFQLRENIKKSTMLAQPVFSSLLRSKKNRKYRIIISHTFKIQGEELNTLELPEDVLRGWIAHELGHLVDYERRSNLGLAFFGLKYLLFRSTIKEAERAADKYAVKVGLEQYIMRTKEYILNHANIAPNYKAKIAKYYLSPEEIMELVEERDHQKTTL